MACELTRARSAWELRQRTNPTQARASADTTKLTPKCHVERSHDTDADHAEVVPPERDADHAEVVPPERVADFNRCQPPNVACELTRARSA